MNINLEKFFADSEAFMDQRRLTLAIQTLEEARRVTHAPEISAYASYNLGVTHWTRFGNGIAARREFLAAAAEFDAHGYGQTPQFLMLHTGALENAMLCALSFDEFDDLAARLRALTPDMPILVGLVPVVREAREGGEPWSNLMFRLAGNYYNRNDPKLDHGRYGEAKSTYHLILTHRRELRLSREDWRVFIFEYSALAMRMASDCMKLRGGDHDPNPPDEYLPILTDPLPLVDEYLAANSGDETMTKTGSDMRSMVTNARGRWLQRPRIASPASPPLMRCRLCQQPINNPLMSCPACGSPSEVMVKAFLAGITGAMICGYGAYHWLASLALWLKVPAVVIAAFFGFGAAGSLVFNHYGRRIVQPRNRSDG